MAEPSLPLCTWEVVNPWTWWIDQWTQSPADWVAALGTAFAAITAVWIYYSTRRDQRNDALAKDQADQRREFERRAVAANLAIHTLGEMFSAIEAARKAMAKHREHALRWYLIKPFEMYIGPTPTFDYASLQYLHGSTDPNLLGHMATEQQRFALLVSLVRRRSDLLLQEGQRKMEEVFAGMPEGAHEISKDQVEAMLGPRLSQLLKELTDSIIDFADRGAESTLAVAGSIVQAARPMTDGERVMAIAAA